MKRGLIITLFFLSISKILAQQPIVEHRWPDSLKGLQDNAKCLLVKNGVIFVGTCFKYLWISADTGRTWVQRDRQHGLTIPFGTVFAIRATPSGKLLLGAFQGIYASTDNGHTWKKVFNRSAFCFLVAQSGAIFAGGSGIWRSTDDGVNWTQVADTSVAWNVWRMTQTPSGVILAGNWSDEWQSAKGIVRSTNNGNNWMLSNNGLTGWAKSIEDLAVYPAGYTSEEVYMMSFLDGAYKSTDGGLNWQRISELNIAHGGAAGVFPPLGVFLGFSRPFIDPLYRSTSSGWEVIPGLKDYFILSLAQYSTNQILVGTNDGMFLLTFPATSVEKEETPIFDFELKQNYPNPFNSTTTIEFHLPVRAYVDLKIFNSLGQEIETLFEGEKDAGIHRIRWNAFNFPNGVYLCRLKNKNSVSTKKILLIK